MAREDSDDVERGRQRGHILPAHSAAPWRAVYDAGDGCYDIAAADGMWIAEEIDEAGDAYLIEAAPKSIAACLELIRGDGAAASIQRAIDLAREAIDIAEGRTHD